MNWIFDLVLAAILVAAVIIGSVKGIARMTVSLIGIGLSLIVAFSVAAPVSEFVYAKCFEKSISDSVDAVVAGYTTDRTDAAVDALFNDKAFLKTAGLLKITSDDVKAAVPGESISEMSRTIKQDIIKPPFLMIIKVIAVIVLMILLLVLVGIVSHLISRAVKATPLSGVNRFFGGVAGFIVGMFLVLAVCRLTDSMLAASPQGFWGITAASRNNSVVYHLVSQLLNALKLY